MSTTGILRNVGCGKNLWNEVQFAEWKMRKSHLTAYKLSLASIFFIRPPVYGSNGRTYKMLVMFSFFFFFFATRSPSSLDRSP